MTEELYDILIKYLDKYDAYVQICADETGFIYSNTEEKVILVFNDMKDLEYKLNIYLGI